MSVASTGAQSGSLSPVEVVKLFESTYGTANMDQAADLTTPKMRSNRPKAVWIYDTWKALQSIDY